MGDSLEFVFHGSSELLLGGVEGRHRVFISYGIRHEFVVFRR